MRMIGWNALRVESRSAGVGQNRGEVVRRWLVADLSVRLSRDKAEVCDIVRLAGCEGLLEDGLGEQMMELKSMLRSGVIERDRYLGLPILRARIPECQEHRLEQRTPLVTPLELLRNDVETPSLLPETINQVGHGATRPQHGEVLVENGLAGPSGVATLRVREQQPVTELLRLLCGNHVVALMSKVRDGDQDERR